MHVRQSVLRLDLVTICFLAAAGAFASPPPGNVLWMHFNEPAGSTVFADSSGLGNNALACAAASCPLAGLASVSGSSVLFSGHEYLDVPASSSLKITGTVTVSVWAYLNALGDQRLVTTEGPTGGYKLNIFASQVEFEVRDADGNVFLNRVPGGVTLNTGQLYHFVGVYSQTDGYIQTYVNGVLDRQSSTTGVLAPSKSDLIIGRDSIAPAFYFSGGMNELSIFNSALTAAQVQTLYRSVAQSGSGTTPAPTPPSSAGQCETIKPPKKAINVVARGASNRGDVDDLAILQNIIDKASAGSTIYFPAGTYNIRDHLSLKSNLTYLGVLGRSKIVLMPGFPPGNGNVFVDNEASPANITIEDLYFAGGGVGIGHLITRLAVRCNAFEAMNGSPGHFDNSGLQTNTGVQNASIIGNKFINAHGSAGWYNWGTLNEVTFQYNYCSYIAECVHTYELTGVNVNFSYNTVLHIWRMGFEIQTAVHNLTIENNYLAQWAPTGAPTNPACAATNGFDCDTFGFSVAMVALPSLATSSVVNNIVLGTTGVSWALEQTSDVGVVQGNLFQNFNLWMEPHFQRGPLKVTNNQMCGGGYWSANSQWVSGNSIAQHCSVAPWGSNVPAPPAPPF